MNKLSASLGDFPLLLSRPIQREDLKWLSPLVIGGCDPLKSKKVAVWLEKLGDPFDLWTLVLRADEESIPYLQDYHALQNWKIMVNEEPAVNIPRIYVFEDIWFVPQSDVTPPSVEEILNLSTTWPVILVPDPDGIPPDYLAPINSLTRDLVNHAHDLQLIGWGKSQLSPTP